MFQLWGSVYIFINAFRDWAKLQSAFSLKLVLTKQDQDTKKSVWNVEIYGKKKKINQASLQLLCQLVKKINPLHDGQRKINPFLNGQDTSKALVDPSGEWFLYGTEKSDH